MRRALLSLVLASACALLQACGSSNSTPTPPPPPPQPQITITVPSDGATVTALPTTLKVTFSNGADPAAMKAQLDGVDITTQFAAADSTGTRQVQVDRPLLNLGKNQLQVFTGTVRASVSFTVVLSGPGSTANATLPLLIPIQTRYMTGDGSHNSDYNIALFADLYQPNTPTTLLPAPNPTGQQPGNQGLQIVFLRRSDLALISNVLVPNEVPPADGNYSNSRSLHESCLWSACRLRQCGMPTDHAESGHAGLYTLFCNPVSSGLRRLHLHIRKAGCVNEIPIRQRRCLQVAYSFIGNSNRSGPNVAAGSTMSGSRAAGQTIRATPGSVTVYPTPAYR